MAWNGILQAGEQPAVVVMDHVGLAVHQAVGPHDVGAEGLADRLVPQADAQDRNLGGKAFDASARDAGLAGRAGAGRDDQMRGRRGRDLVERDLVVAMDLEIERRSISPNRCTRL